MTTPTKRNFAGRCASHGSAASTAHTFGHWVAVGSASATLIVSTFRLYALDSAGIRALKYSRQDRSSATTDTHARDRVHRSGFGLESERSQICDRDDCEPSVSSNAKSDTLPIPDRRFIDTFLGDDIVAVTPLRKTHALDLQNGKDHATAENQINHTARRTIRRSACIRWFCAT